MPSVEEITTFRNDPPPPGESPWVAGRGPSTDVVVVEPDPTWPQWYDALAARVRDALGPRVLWLQHVGSTSVPGLAAKPVIDADLVVADPDDEAAYVPALEAAGFDLTVREPWWYGHRLLKYDDPRCHLHVFGPDSPEVVRHRLFRDWLTRDADDLARYAAVKREAAEAAQRLGEHGMEYNARKESLVRDIYARMFEATGLRAAADAARRPRVEDS